jgi:hypothetical protein
MPCCSQTETLEDEGSELEDEDSKLEDEMSPVCGSVSEEQFAKVTIKATDKKNMNGFILTPWLKQL